eukprot:TRINITY_DN51127_c0_g1_i1.p1 TRINITY_DN51127_c0_g1~~TRINITY_DN51127_c0_g1_i1.p1  ORF type:complete len:557 (-),score=51.20 TRINITY_DN51127_c0_g1_i1:321-1934(-)
MRTMHSEVDYCAHMSLPGILLPPPKSDNIVNYARTVHSLLIKHSYANLMLTIPLSLNNEEDENSDAAWLLWNKFRTLCSFHNRLTPALELTPNLPVDELLLRWTAEPVRTLIIPLSTFVHDMHGRPVLSRKHQAFTKLCLQFKAQIVFTGGSQLAEEGGGSPKSQLVYRPYRAHILALKKSIPPLSEIEKFKEPYYDYLQCPLQPLQDHLDSATYETFEKDPIKYKNYGLAIRKALQDKHKATATPENPAIVMVVGAGRGPLVNQAIKAGQDANVPIKVWAVEKNPNAIVTLKAMQRQRVEWGVVDIVHCDMRTWQPAQPCDILVSELLGSFGDNELSPECLDGAQRFLAEGGISIPYKYTSYLSPLMSHKIYNDIANYNDLEHYETPYVVNIHSGVTLAEPQEVFTFEHPNPEFNSNFNSQKHPTATNPDNTRATQLSFSVNCNALVHGFAGYFTAWLYKDITISIHPKTHSKDMFSWFPIVFPLRNPCTVRQGEEVQVNFWRCVSPTQVWYEWSLTAPHATSIQNPNGRSYHIGL